MRNKLFKVVVKYSDTFTMDSKNLLAKYNDKVAGYFIYKENGNFIVHYNLSTEPKFNTYDIKYLIPLINYEITSDNSEGETVVNYLNPPLDICIQMFEPTIVKVADTIHHQWRTLEVDDLRQTGYLLICKLFKKAYINIHLLEKAFHREVLMELRKQPIRHKDIPIEAFYRSLDEDYESGQDKIVDKKQEEHFNKYIDDISNNQILCKVCDIIRARWGERGLEQWIREYSYAGKTTEWGRSFTRKIKVHFNNMGFDLNYFIRGEYED